MVSLSLSFRRKLFFGIVLSLFLVMGMGGLIASWVIENQLRTQALQQMEATGEGVHNMVRSLVRNAIKNYLKGISETNLAYLQHAYAQSQAGLLTEAQAKRRAQEFIQAQTIGRSGYIVGIESTTAGSATLIAHPYLRGQDISDTALLDRMTKQKSGYMEFEWKNPNDPLPRLKSAWVSYFAPWHWMVNPSPFVDEYPQLIDLNGIESELPKLDMHSHGYVFIMDMQGNLLSHPVLKGHNILNVPDAKTGVLMVRNTVESIQKARAENRPEGFKGLVEYHFRNPGSEAIYPRMLHYRYVPEADWFVGVVTNLDELNEPVTVIRNTLFAVLFGALLVALKVVAWILRSMTRSVSQLVRAVEAIDGGHLNAPLPINQNDEIGRLALAFKGMSERLARYTADLEQRVSERTAELEQANQRLALLSATDGLTGLSNRRHFDAALDEEWARAQRTQQPLALIMLDVDHFKKFNDRYGHQAGDDCLQKVAGVLQAYARRAGDVAARYGGEEFILIAPNMDLFHAQVLAEAIRTAVEQLGIEHLDAAAGHVTCSLGLAVMSVGQVLDRAVLLHQADEALYRAKRHGRNRVESADLEKDTERACLSDPY